MRVPARLNELLETDRRLRAAVDETLLRFEPWLKLNRLAFFPEYTDHGITHVEDVLCTASGLISDESWNVVSAGDAAVLVVSVVLHDAGMHLTPDGFRQLVDAGAPRRFPSEFADVPWPRLWSDFLGESSRFNDRKLTQLFGDCIPVAVPNLNNLNERDFLLIGEFLRRHHPRLAHEIALSGVPGPTSDPIRLPDGLDEPDANLVGLIARSHGMDLRAAIEFLERPPYSNNREFRGIHAAFLMSVLRVADYVQVQSERAPREALKVARLRSPYSRREWDVHQSVRDVNNSAQEDPELLYINAAPENIETFMRLDQWLNGIQVELDSSWAVLGEVYGRFDRLKSLGLHLRRVKSNIRDAAFTKRLNFSPRDARFRTSEAELLPLLIRPLYGDKPEIGIRELMQNSIDAVRELRLFLKRHPDLCTDFEPLDGDVVVSVASDRDGNWFVEVNDCGIGMTEDVICNYFLKVGASYRRSDAWRAFFENESHHSMVLRSGRFGVGVLAAFLLGNEVHVSTRPVSAPKDGGIEFSATVETETIQLNRLARPVGTTVRVGITADLAQRLLQQERRWDWYCLDDPKVVRRHAGAPHDLLQHYRVPNARDQLSGEWRRTEVPGYEDVQWKLADSNFACNGIAILGVMPPVHLSVAIEEDVPNFPLVPHHPFSLSVFDPDGTLPLTLTREKLLDLAPPFRGLIWHDIFCELLAYLLAYGPSSFPSPGDGNEWIGKISDFAQLSRQLNSNWYGLIGCLGTLTGFGLIEPWTLSTARIRRLLLLENGPSSDRRIAALSINDHGDAFAILQSRLPNSPHTPQPPRAKAWVEAVIGHARGFRRGEPLPLRRYSTGRRTMIPRAAEAEINAEVLDHLVRPIRQFRDEWSIQCAGACPDDVPYQEKLHTAASDAGANISDWMLGEWFFDDYSRPASPSPLMKVWIETLKQPLIPYDPDERRRQLGGAFDKLAPYIDRLERQRTKA